MNNSTKKQTNKTFQLPGSLTHLFKKELAEIKAVGFNLANAAYALQANYELLFQNPNHYQFFFYENDKMLRQKEITKKCLEKIAKLTSKAIKTRERLTKKLNNSLEKEQRITRSAAIRFQDIQYCKRKIVSLVFHEMFYEALRLKKIGGKEGELAYASDLMLNLKQKQNEYNSKLLASKGVLISGKFHSLSKFVMKGEKKVAELYANVKGMQELASERGYGWAFLTMTAPAKYHANPTKGRNSWNGQSVKEAHNYLLECQKELGKSLKDVGIYMSNGDIFGMRVVEPHKDGTPHWHMVLFYDKKHEDVLFSYDGLYPTHFSNNGRNKKQLDIVIGIIDQDTSKENKVASAASYCFKYITKAIGTDFLEETCDLAEVLKEQKERSALKRIIAWRSAVNIRAYQPIGLPSSRTKWNAFRKISMRAGYARVIKSQDKHGQSIRNYQFEGDFDFKHQGALLANELNELSQKPSIEDFYQRIDIENEQKLRGLNSLLPQNNLITPLDELEAYGHFNNAVYESESFLHYLDVDLPPSLDFDEMEAFEMHYEKEFSTHCVLNSGLSTVEQLEFEYKVKQVLKHAVNGNFKLFIEAIIESDLDFKKVLLTEPYTNRYGEEKKKLIGVNVGKWVYLFKSYKIIDKPNEPSEALKYLEELADKTKSFAAKLTDNVIEGYIEQLFSDSKSKKFKGLDQLVELARPLV